MKQISVPDFRILIKEASEITLIDVREEDEHEAFNLGGLNIPLGELMQNATAIPKSGNVIIYCKRGIRSAIAIQRLEDRFGYTNLINLQGGTEEWKALN